MTRVVGVQPGPGEAQANVSFFLETASFPSGKTATFGSTLRTNNRYAGSSQKGSLKAENGRLNVLYSDSRTFEMEKLQMFLTTESGLARRNYERVRIISGTVLVTGWKEEWEAATENALGKLYLKALELGADAVIGVQISTSEKTVTVIGTAIKFLDEETSKAGHDQSDSFML